MRFSGSFLLFLSALAWAGSPNVLTCRLADLAKPGDPQKLSYSLPGGSLGELSVEAVLHKTPNKGPGGVEYGKVFLSFSTAPKEIKEVLLTGRALKDTNYFSEFHLVQGKVLDIGCGMHGLAVQDMVKKGMDAQGLDIVAEMVPGNHLVRASSTKMPFEDNQFDSIVSSNAVFYYTDAQDPHKMAVANATLREVVRVLKPGGRLFLDMGESVLQALRTQNPDIQIIENQGFYQILPAK